MPIKRVPHLAMRRLPLLGRTPALRLCSFVAASLIVAALPFSVSATPAEPSCNGSFSHPAPTIGMSHPINVRRFGAPTLPLPCIPEGDALAGLEVGVTNTFDRKPGKFLFDAEVTEVAPTLLYSPWEDGAITASAPIEIWGGGFLDEGIDSVHELLHTPNGGRPKEPPYSMTVAGELLDGREFELRESGTSLPFVRVGLEQGWQNPFAELTPEGSRGALSATLQLPVDGNNFTDDSWGVIGGAALAIPLHPVQLVFGGRLGAFSETSLPGGGSSSEPIVGEDPTEIDLRHLQGGLTLAVQAPFTPHWSGSATLFGNSQAATNIKGFPDVDLYSDFSFSWHPEPSQAVTGTFRQNPLTVGTADVSFLLALSLPLSL